MDNNDWTTEVKYHEHTNGNVPYLVIGVILGALAFAAIVLLDFQSI